MKGQRSHPLGLPVGGALTFDGASRGRPGALDRWLARRIAHAVGAPPIEFALWDGRLEHLYAAPEAADAAWQVELLTMHGAKRLQWDTVILPGLGHKGANADAPLLAFTEVPVCGGAMPLMAAKASTRQKDDLYSLVNKIEKNKYNNELKRLLYVACTRPETTLHMLGHVSESKGEAATGSLLHLLLSNDEACFGAQLHAIESIHVAAETGQMPLQRVACVPEPAALESVNQSELETEYIWAGAEAAPVGNAVHAALQYVAQTGIESWDEHHTQAALKRMSRILVGDGLSGVVLNGALARCTEGFQRVLNSEKGKWILSGNHQQAHQEWALSLEYDDHISHHAIDRSFIDADGVRWIIDYKTATHEGGDLESFLDIEVQRHAAQLHRYMALLQLREPEREIRAALYFPMLDGWRELV